MAQIPHEHYYNRGRHCQDCLGHSMKDENDEREGPGGRLLVEGNHSQDVENQDLAHQNCGGNAHGAHHVELMKSREAVRSVGETCKHKGSGHDLAKEECSGRIQVGSARLYAPAS